MSDNEKGVIYLALGVPYLSMALASMATLKAKNPNLPVCIVSNASHSEPFAPFWQKGLDNYVVIDEKTTLKDKKRAGFFLKTKCLEYSPFQKTVFLDCDTIVMKEISTLYKQLKYFDFLARPAKMPGKEGSKIIVDGEIKYSNTAHFNTGVLGFSRNETTRNFFEIWSKSYLDLWIKNDEPAFLEAYYKSDACLLPLEPKWNSGDRWLSSKAEREAISIWHYKVRLEPVVEKLVSRAVDWFEPISPRANEEVRSYIKSRRDHRRDNSLRWKSRQLIANIRGSQSKRLKNGIDDKYWNSLF